MKIKLKKWLTNLPWKLKQVLICDLFGHKPALDLQFFKGVTTCERCMSPLIQVADGSWTGDFAVKDLKKAQFPWENRPVYIDCRTPKHNEPKGEEIEVQ